MSSDPLDRLARRVADDDFFLSSALTAYQDRHRLDDAGLARSLECAVATLTHLRLCRRPEGDEDVRAIARHFNIDPAALARVIAEAGAGPEVTEGDPD